MYPVAHSITQFKGRCMADEAKKGFPVIPVKHWWALRERFRKSVPSKVDAQYVASVLNMSEGSAQNNILPTLRTTAIIDDEGKPTDLAVKWRDDHEYAAVCKEIREQVYPAQLLEVAPSTAERDEARRWFSGHSKGGESLVGKLTAIYMLLCEADPTKANSGSTSSSSGEARAKKKAADKPVGHPPKPPRGSGADGDESKRGEKRVTTGPSLHFNVQIHIAADASSDQIEQIFASMGKHLKQLSE